MNTPVLDVEYLRAALKALADVEDSLAHANSFKNPIRERIEDFLAEADGTKQNHDDYFQDKMLVDAYKELASNISDLLMDLAEARCSCDVVEYYCRQLVA